MRGTVAHLIFEVLANPRHEKYIKEIIANNTCLKSAAIVKLIVKTAKKEGLDLDEEVAPLKKGGDRVTNLKCIDEMVMVGLKFDFIDEQARLIGSEIEFDITNESPKYRIGGYIDRVFEKNSDLIIRDFKSSKQTFKGEELNSNIQAMIYALAMYKKYGKEYRDILVKFLFLRFPKDPEKECPKFTEEQLRGFEYFLEHISKHIASFNEETAVSNLAAKTYDKKWMCQTKSGWKCPYLDSFEYKALIDSNNQIVKSALITEEIPEQDVKPGMRIEIRKYAGCPAWNGSSKNEFDF
jgi:hypothetical protein